MGRLHFWTLELKKIIPVLGRSATNDESNQQSRNHFLKHDTTVDFKTMTKTNDCFLQFDIFSDKADLKNIHSFSVE